MHYQKKLICGSVKGLEDTELNKVKRSFFQITFQPILKFLSEPMHLPHKRALVPFLEGIF